MNNKTFLVIKNNKKVFATRRFSKAFMCLTKTPGALLYEVCNGKAYLKPQFYIGSDLYKSSK